MNYELAKQLKEAGFPQECSYPSEIYSDKEKGDGTIEGGFFYRKPSLSELIEACGYKFYSLTSYAQKTLSGDGKDEWVAKAWQVEKAEGSTPEEAVAKLWLIINQK